MSRLTGKVGLAAAFGIANQLSVFLGGQPVNPGNLESVTASGDTGRRINWRDLPTQDAASLRLGSSLSAKGEVAVAFTLMRAR